MTIQMIPLTQLVPSAANVRKTAAGAGIEALAASIAAHGLLQNLQVRETTGGKYAVVAGARRLAALKLLAKRKALAKDAPVACHVMDEASDTEISLAENELRMPMHPADQFDAFKALIDGGQGVEDIAARFGVTPALVRQRLKLAGVTPVLMALYRDEQLTLDQLMAFTLSDDHAAQEAAWFEAPPYDRQPYGIRRRLTAAHVAATDDRVLFVTLDVYRAAGGGIVTDLFQRDHEGYLTDPALLDRLVNEKLEQAADAVRQEGWNWVEIVPVLTYDALHGFARTHGKREPLPPKQARALAKAEKQRDALAEADELTDEQSERYDALEAEIAALEKAQLAWSDRQKRNAGAVIGIQRGGVLAVERGLIRASDKQARKLAALDENENGEGESKAPALPAGLSARLADDLTAHRTAALRALLANRPDMALVTLAHSLALPVFYDEQDSGLDLRTGNPTLRAEGIDESKATAQLAERRTAWAACLPQEAEGLWAWLAAQDSGTLTGLLASCLAGTLEARRGSLHDRLATALGLDMAAWWQPTAESYFGRVPKPLILEAVREGVTPAAAASLVPLKKAQMAERAEALLAGTNWLPSALRAA